MDEVQSVALSVHGRCRPRRPTREVGENLNYESAGE